jgi:hypothetical protein
VLNLADTRLRPVMWRASLVTALFGLTEPLFVPAYWNPPSLFELAQRTGFDIESLIFAFAIGGIGTVLYDTPTRQHLVAASPVERTAPLHRCGGKTAAFKVLIEEGTELILAAHCSAPA